MVTQIVVWGILIVALYFLLFFVLLPNAAYFIARADKQLTTVPSGEIKAIVQGDTLKRILINVEGWDINNEGVIFELSPEGKLAQANRAKSPFEGIYWVGLDYPKTRVLTYFFEWDKLKRTKGATEYEVEHRAEWVNSLYWRYPYPVPVLNVELQGNFRVDIVVNVTLQVTRPYIPLFVLKGKWLPQVISTIEGAVTDYVKKQTFDVLRADTKAGDSSELSKAIKKINDQVPDNPESGIEKAFGVKVFKVDFVSFEPSAQQKEILEAITAVERARLEAEAAIKEAEGEREALLIKADGESGRLEKLLNVAKKEGDKGLAILQTEIATRNLGPDSKLTTLVTGSSLPVVPAITIAENKPSKEEPKKSEGS